MRNLANEIRDKTWNRIDRQMRPPRLPSLWAEWRLYIPISDQVWSRVARLIRARILEAQSQIKDNP